MESEVKRTNKKDKVFVAFMVIVGVFSLLLLISWDTNKLDTEELNQEAFSQEEVKEGVITEISIVREDSGETFKLHIDNGDDISLLGTNGKVYWIDESRHGEVGKHYFNMRNNTIEIDVGDKVEYKTANVYGYNEDERNELSVLTKHETK